MVYLDHIYNNLNLMLKKDFANIIPVKIVLHHLLVNKLSFNFLNACPADRKFKLNKSRDIQGFKANSPVLLNGCCPYQPYQGYVDVSVLRRRILV